jgi:predicted aldo/keto reductase-like oxidoreductase
MESFLGQDIRKLGFGLMRLPMVRDQVDIRQVKEMVDLFLEKGFTYFDTAYGYINGLSEAAVKEALVDRYERDRYQLATKLPAWFAATKQQARDMFWTSLKRTGVEYFDFYLLHNLGASRTVYFEKFGIWDFLFEQKARGRIRHLGFSIHAKAEQLEEVLLQHPEAEFVQLQINYADWEHEVIQSRKCYEVARKYSKPVIIMEPVKGGALANLPENAARIFSLADPGVSYASWAIRFAASLEGIITVLSGMSNLDQMRDNLSYMEDFKPLNQDELGIINGVRKLLSGIPQIPCTDCRYCLESCPQNIAIPGTFRAMNDYLVYKDLPRVRGIYAWETLFLAKASGCTACGHCETACPQNIPIIEELSRAVKILEGE